MNDSVRAFSTLLTREIVRFLRQPSRIVASVGTVALLWVFLGAGVSGSFETGGPSTYGGFMLPGMIAMIAMFSSIFGAISLIEDRAQGLLQAMLMAPTPRLTIVASKVAGGSLVALIQAFALLLAAPLVGVSPSLVGILEAVAVIAAMCIGVTGLSLGLAWHVESVAGFHGVMNLILMPMWLLSGSLFPVEGAHPGLRTGMWCNPMTWCVESLRAAIEGSHVSWVVPIGAAGFAGFGLAAALGRMGWTR